jgi:hypothetical protein
MLSVVMLNDGMLNVVTPLYGPRLSFFILRKLGIKSVSEFNYLPTSCGSAVVDHSTPNPKIKGSDTAAKKREEIMGK